MSTILKLRPNEQDYLDKNRLAEFIPLLGRWAADDIISRTMEELTVQLVKVYKSSERGRFNDILVAA